MSVTLDIRLKRVNKTYYEEVCMECIRTTIKIPLIILYLFTKDSKKNISMLNKNDF